MLFKLVRPAPLPSADYPVLVLLHGIGADENDLMGLAPNMDPRLTVVCFRAPHEYGLSGYAWFNVEWHANGFTADEEQALESRELLIEGLKALPDELGFKPGKLFLGGFSQGAIMSLGVSMEYAAALTGVVLMSGRPLPSFVAGSPSDKFAKLPFIVQHGVGDQVLSILEGRAIRAFLELKGCPLSYREYPIGHEISYQSLQDVNSWLAERLG